MLMTWMLLVVFATDLPGHAQYVHLPGYPSHAACVHAQQLVLRRTRAVTAVCLPEGKPHDHE